jgi:hypothetical protein
MQPSLLQESGQVSGAGGKGVPMNLESMVKAMRALAARAAHMGGTDPDVAAIARSLADLGQMAAAIGERVLDVEDRVAQIAGRTLPPSMLKD